jgi:retron-type reverse transcriptase
MKSVARRISDRHLLHLLKMWLETPVEETDERGRIQRTTRNKDEGRGTPQGGVASPLLANLYMRRFILAGSSWATSSGCKLRSSTMRTTVRHEGGRDDYRNVSDAMLRER